MITISTVFFKNFVCHNYFINFFYKICQFSHIFKCFFLITRKNYFTCSSILLHNFVISKFVVLNVFFKNLIVNSSQLHNFTTSQLLQYLNLLSFHDVLFIFTQIYHFLNFRRCNLFKFSIFYLFNPI